MADDDDPSCVCAPPLTLSSELSPIAQLRSLPLAAPHSMPHSQPSAHALRRLASPLLSMPPFEGYTHQICLPPPPPCLQLVPRLLPLPPASCLWPLSLASSALTSSGLAWWPCSMQVSQPSAASLARHARRAAAYFCVRTRPCPLKRAHTWSQGSAASSTASSSTASSSTASSPSASQWSSR